jgi:hypothetical protein
MFLPLVTVVFVRVHVPASSGKYCDCPGKTFSGPAIEVRFRLRTLVPEVGQISEPKTLSFPLYEVEARWRTLTQTAETHQRKRHILLMDRTGSAL